MDAEVIVIGAGVPVPAAAARLGRKGRRVLLIVARERVGGRVCSHRPRAPGLAPREFGAQLRELRLHDWRRDPYRRGAYGYPVAGRWFFANEAVSDALGTVQGRSRQRPPRRRRRAGGDGLRTGRGVR